MKHKLCIIIHIALAIGILLPLSGCSASRLKTLESTAAVIQLHTGREASRWQQDEGTVLGKQAYAKLRIGYEPINDHTKQDVFEEIIAILEANHWVRTDENIVPDGYLAYLQQGNVKILTTVLIKSDQNLVTVLLEAR